MSSGAAFQAKALRAASELGCSGVHKDQDGNWVPCSSFTEYKDALMRKAGVSKITQEDIGNWNSRRKKKGRKRRSGYEKLRERGVLGINTLPSGGLVSAPISTAAVNDASMSVKSMQVAFSPRDEDMDVFMDIESARKRSRQLGCIGVSRRISKSGKIVWMPCTNMSDYDRLAGTTPLGRRHQKESFTRAVRTVLKNSSRTRKKSLAEELHEYKGIGRTLRNRATSLTQRFDPKAEDGDGDGILQDGTAFQRPAIVSQVGEAVRKLAPKKQRRSPAEEWFHSIPESEREARFGTSIDEFADMDDSMKSQVSRALSKPITGLRSSSAPPSDNPKATPLNPYNEMGGRAMGRIILGRVRPEHRNKQGQKTTYFIAGTTGSGKSSVVENHLQANGIVPNDDEAAHIDPDFIKMGIPGFNDGAGSEAIHPTSRVATDKVLKDATSQGMDIIVQGTGRRTEHLRGAKRAGYRTVGHYVYASDDVAEARAIERNNKTARKIPVRLSRKMAGIIPYSVSEAFQGGLLDEFYLWDNDTDGATPKLIARKVPGQPMEIFDRPKFEDFAKSKSRAAQWEQDANAGDKTISGNTPGLRSRSKKGGGGKPKPKGGRVTPSSKPQTTIFGGPTKEFTSKQLRYLDRAIEAAKRDPQLLAEIDKEASRQRAIIKGYIRQGRVTEQQISSLFGNATVDEILDLVAPVDMVSLEKALSDNPYVLLGKYSSQDLIDGYKQNESLIDWDAAKIVRDNLRDNLENNLAFREFVNRFGIAPSICMARGTRDIQRNSNGSISTMTEPWGSVHGCYIPIVGIIEFNPDRVKQNGNLLIGGQEASVSGMIRHEFGHAMHSMAASTSQAAKDAYDKATDEGSRDAYARVVAVRDEVNKLDLNDPTDALKAKVFRNQLLMLELETKKMENTEIHLTISDEMIKDALKISDYAATAFVEYFAEMFRVATGTGKKEDGEEKTLNAKQLQWFADSLGMTMEELSSILSTAINGKY